MKQQIILVHGGTTFNSYEDYIHFLKTVPLSLEYLKKESWKDSLQNELGAGFDVVKLQMPNKTSAKYSEWKIYFERYIDLFQDNAIMIGHSLGGIFLAKFLSENTYPKKIKEVYLIGAPYDDTGLTESLGDFILPKSLENMASQSGKISLLFSEDDPVVPVVHANKYKEKLINANLKIFKDKRHFSQALFPEIVQILKGNF